MITKVPMLCVIRVTIFHEWRPGWALVITHNMRKKQAIRFAYFIQIKHNNTFKSSVNEGMHPSIYFVFHTTLAGV